MIKTLIVCLNNGSIDKASWKAQDGESVDSTHQTLHFYREMLRGFAKSDQLLGGVLLLNDKPVATVICAHDKGTCHTLKTAMRHELSGARLSPGALVMARLLEHVWTHPAIHAVDFVSKQPYTERWTSENQTFERHLAFASSWRGTAVRYIDNFFLLSANMRSGGRALSGK